MFLSLESGRFFFPDVEVLIHLNITLGLLLMRVLEQCEVKASILVDIKGIFSI